MITQDLSLVPEIRFWAIHILRQHIFVFCWTHTLCRTNKVVNVSNPPHIGAKWPFIFRWGFDKPLLRIHDFIENKNVALKKLVIKGTFRLIPYIHKNWSLSTLNLPVQDLNSKTRFFGKCKNWGFQFQK